MLSHGGLQFLLVSEIECQLPTVTNCISMKMKMNQRTRSLAEQNLYPFFLIHGSKALYYGSVVKPTNLEEWKTLFLLTKSIKRILVVACGETLVTFLMVLSDTAFI